MPFSEPHTPIHFQTPHYNRVEYRCSRARINIISLLSLPLSFLYRSSYRTYESNYLGVVTDSNALYDSFWGKSVNIRIVVTRGWKRRSRRTSYQVASVFLLRAPYRRKKIRVSYNVQTKMKKKKSQREEQTNRYYSKATLLSLSDEGNYLWGFLNRDKKGKC